MVSPKLIYTFKKKNTEIHHTYSSIKLLLTDGDSDNHPTNTIYNPDAEGHVNYMDKPGVASDKLWKRKIGKAIAEHLNMSTAIEWSLIEWPKGYKLYAHKKGLASSPRIDRYLYGPHQKPFRSPEEFEPHAIWMVEGMPLDAYNRPTCTCKYCINSPQKPNQVGPIRGQRSGRTRAHRGYGRGNQQTRRARAPSPPLLTCEPRFEGAMPT